MFYVLFALMRDSVKKIHPGTSYEFFSGNSVIIVWNTCS